MIQYKENYDGSFHLAGSSGNSRRMLDQQPTFEVQNLPYDQSEVFLVTRRLNLHFFRMQNDTNSFGWIVGTRNYI